jgi:hypothetical protein
VPSTTVSRSVGRSTHHRRDPSRKPELHRRSDVWHRRWAPGSTRPARAVPLRVPADQRPVRHVASPAARPVAPSAPG